MSECFMQQQRIMYQEEKCNQQMILQNEQNQATISQYYGDNLCDESPVQLGDGYAISENCTSLEF